MELIAWAEAENEAPPIQGLSIEVKHTVLNQNQGYWYSGVLGRITPWCGLSDDGLFFVI